MRSASFLFFRAAAKRFNVHVFEKIKNFTKSYGKESEYSDFLKFVMPSPQTTASLDIFVGTGYINPTSKLENYFNGNAVFSMSVDFCINKIYASFYVNTTSFSLKQPFSATTKYETLDFRKGDRLSYFDGGLLAGYFVIQNKRFHVAPYATIAGGHLQSNIYSDSKEHKDKDIYIFNSFICGPGLHTEIKLLDYDYHIALKLELGYNFITTFKHNEFEGNLFYAKAGIVLGIGNF